MGIEYAKVLKGMRVPFDVVGRSATSADAFEKAIGIKPFIGGLRSFLDEYRVEQGTQAIIATGTEFLLHAIRLLVKSGVKEILIEKPAAVSIEELIENEKELKSLSGNFFVAYNRRFYQSVLTAEKLIQEDGGLKSLFFEFTEWSHSIENAPILDIVKSNWYFANSSHVVDTAFFLAGYPKTFYANAHEGQSRWHKQMIFSGSGVTTNNVLFSYMANWESAGRWGVELLTNRRKIILRPMEKLTVQERGSLEKKPFYIDDQLDIDYKPGLWNQVEAFLNNDHKRMLTLREHVMNAKYVHSTVLNGGFMDMTGAAK